MLKSVIDEKGYAVLDGGFSTTLEMHGYRMDPVLWSGYAVVDNPSAVVDVHRQFISAGADIITTSSYQMSAEGFRTKGVDDLEGSIALYRKATELAQLAVRESATRSLVAASMGTYGAHLSDGSEYSGNYGKSVKELVEWHRPKMLALASSGADIIACETVPCVSEVRSFHQLLNTIGDSFDLSSTWISLACRSSRELNSGESIEDALRAIEDPAESLVESKTNCSIGIGVNCTSPSYVNEIVHMMVDTCSKSRLVVAYPNLGELWDGERKLWVSPRPDSIVVNTFEDTLVRSWRESGASVIGGCCRTTPQTTSSTRTILEGLKVCERS